jgi:hypothetical protein
VGNVHITAFQATVEFNPAVCVSVMVIQGAAQLDGPLYLQLPGGSIPGSPLALPIIHADAITGSLELPEQVQWQNQGYLVDIRYTNTTATLELAPLMVQPQTSGRFEDEETFLRQIQDEPTEELALIAVLFMVAVVLVITALACQLNHQPHWLRLLFGACIVIIIMGLVMFWVDHQLIIAFLVVKVMGAILVSLGILYVCMGCTRRPILAVTEQTSSDQWNEALLLKQPKLVKPVPTNSKLVHTYKPSDKPKTKVALPAKPIIPTSSANPPNSVTPANPIIPNRARPARPARPPRPPRPPRPARPANPSNSNTPASSASSASPPNPTTPVSPSLAPNPTIDPVNPDTPVDLVITTTEYVTIEY